MKDGMTLKATVREMMCSCLATGLGTDKIFRDSEFQECKRLFNVLRVTVTLN